MVWKNQNKLFGQLNTIHHLHLGSKISHSELSIYKTETDSQTETDLWFAKREGWIWSLGLADADCYVQNGLNDKI